MYDGIEILIHYLSFLISVLSNQSIISEMSVDIELLLMNGLLTHYLYFLVSDMSDDSEILSVNGYSVEKLLSDSCDLVCDRTGQL